MADQKWYRQDSDEISREWFLFMSTGARVAWIALKAYVREASVSQKRANVAPALGHRSAAQRWNIAPQEVEEMIAAATEAGELTVSDGAWIVNDVRLFVSDSTLKRMHAADDLNPFEGQTGSEKASEDQTGPQQTSDVQKASGETEPDLSCHVTSTVTSTSTDSETSLRSVSGGGDAAAPAVDEWAGVPESQRPQWARTNPNHSWLMAERVLWQVHDEVTSEGRDWDPPTDTEIRRAMKDEGPLWWLSDKYGEDEAVAMFVFAVRNWSTLPSGWDQILSQHRQIRDKMAKAATQAKAMAPKRETVEEAKARVRAKMSGQGVEGAA